MAPKRDAPETLTGASKKRAKMRQQRVIPVESHPSTITRLGGSAENGNNTLPPTIDVEKFAQARSFEITAMQRSMKTAKEAGTQRAFQSLPRHLRRRAASHNIKRLPIKLRSKALFETPKDSAKPKKKTRKLVGRKRRLTAKSSRTAILLKRQLSKIWLETHIWHAKRMHMTEIWGHRLAEKPTEKAFRSSYRASFHGALIHDASYYQYIELWGSDTALNFLLNSVLDQASPSPLHSRYLKGTRELKTNIYGYKKFPYELIGPVTFIVRAGAGTYTWHDPTKLLIRIHPSIAIKVLDALTLSLRYSGHSDVIITPLKKEFLTFEITGRRATEVVKAVLKPVVQTDVETKKAWEKLSSTAGPGSVPTGMIFGMTVDDPRLSFPPKLDKSNPELKISDLLEPTLQIAQVLSFWDKIFRSNICKPKFKKMDLDARRSKLLIPGTKLQPTSEDDKIPILLSQNTITSNNESNKTDEMSGWTLMIPSGWGMAFWSSLVFSETRIGGLRERSQQFFEAGSSRFPEDFPTTQAFKEYEERRQANDQLNFDKKPPAKRPNYNLLGTQDPFLSNFESILKRWVVPKTIFLGEESNKGLPRINSRSPWLVPESILKTIILHQNGTQFIPTDESSRIAQELLNDWSGAPYVSNGVDCFKDFGPLAGALVRVKITPYGRGSPEELGCIYWLDDRGNRYQEILNSLRLKNKDSRKKSLLANGEVSDVWMESGNIPTIQDVIGRITTGNYSLSQGHGSAVGVIPLSAYLAMKDRDHVQSLLKTKEDPRNSNKMDFPMLAVVRNRDGNVYRPVMLSLMP